MIPTKITGVGDLVVAREWVKFAKNRLAILKRQRSLGGKQDYSTISPHPGIVVECFSGRRIEEIKITVIKAGGEAGQSLIEKKKIYCKCFPHFSFGVVRKVTPVDPVDPAFLPTGKFMYDLEVCAKDRFILYENAYDVNFGKYYVGQRVMVTIGGDMPDWPSPMDCERMCLVKNPRFEFLTISPVHFPGMSKWFPGDEDKKVIAA